MAKASSKTRSGDGADSEPKSKKPAPEDQHTGAGSAFDPSEINPAVERITLSSLIEDDANANVHTEADLAPIERSLRRFGQVQPLLIREGGRVIGGNGRLVVMRDRLKWRFCNVMRVDHLSDAEALALAIALNKTARIAEFDETILAQQLDELLDTQDGLDGLGFNDEELDRILTDAQASIHGAGEEVSEVPTADEVPPDRYESTYAVIVTCDDEEAQQAAYEALSAEGYNCKVVTT